MTSGPYAPRNWALGGAPNKAIDVPVTSICLALYVCGAATHMTIFQLNQRRGHKFLFNAVLFGPCPSPPPPPPFSSPPPNPHINSSNILLFFHYYLLLSIYRL